MGRECDEAAESATAWENCQKNVGHEDFIPVRDFTGTNLPVSVSDEDLKMIRFAADLTVRLRVNWTSLERPGDDDLSDYRGSSRIRLGTGIINHWQIWTNKPCPCTKCDGKIVKNHWTFRVYTARNVVYNTEEAERTRVDLFYDDERSKQDGKVVTMSGNRAEFFEYNRDVTNILFVTHDEEIGEKFPVDQDVIQIYRPCNENFQVTLNFPSFNSLDTHYALIISHPHGQPKKITVGKMRHGMTLTKTYTEYHTATCPGSSGAPVFAIIRDLNTLSWKIHRKGYVLESYVHSGTYDRPLSVCTEQQTNYGHFKLYGSVLKRCRKRCEEEIGIQQKKKKIKRNSD